MKGDCFEQQYNIVLITGYNQSFIFKIIYQLGYLSLSKFDKRKIILQFYVFYPTLIYNSIIRFSREFTWYWYKQNFAIVYFGEALSLLYAFLWFSYLLQIYLLLIMIQARKYKIICHKKYDSLREMVAKIGSCDNVCLFIWLLPVQ